MAKKITKEKLKKEIIKCGSDPIYFLNTYGKISHPNRGLLPFKTFQYQDDIVNGILKHKKNIILKSRQIGASTIIAGFIAWFIIYHKDKNVLVISTKQEVAKNVIRTIKNVINFIPEEIMPCKCITDNVQSVELSNRSRVKAITTSEDAGRSEAVSLLFVDEAAIISKFEQIATGLFPVVSSGGRIVLASTPKGTGNYFHKLYTQAQRGENKFNCNFGTYINPRNTEEVYTDRFPWWVQPEYDEEWFESETAGKSPRDIAQEYLCSFSTSGDTFILPEILMRLEAAVQSPIERMGMDNNVWIWEFPEKSGLYLISADIASGIGKDFSAFHVLRIDTKIEQVAEYKGKLSPDMLGLLLVEVSRMYNNAFIAPENNSGWSGQTILKIQESNWPFLYYSPKKKNEIVDQYSAHLYGGAIAGYTVSNQNRVPMLSKMEQYIRQNDIILYSSRLLEEFRTFIYVGQRPEAMRSYHDDAIMALAGGLWVREEGFMTAYRGEEETKIMINAMSVTSKTTNNIKDFDYQSSLYFGDNKYVMGGLPFRKDFVQNGKELTADALRFDISWLLGK